MTEARIFARYGKSEQMYRLKFVSNQEFTDGEFERWKAVMAEVPCAPPLLYEVQEKVGGKEGRSLGVSMMG